jgi:hypothetical protein
MKAFGILAAIALTGCGSAATPSAVAPGAIARSSTSVAVRAPAVHPDRRPSWVSPDAKGSLLFVSDAGTADVYMYALSTLKLVGTITGFVQPQGECADAKGDVWITDTNAQTIYEVSHAGRLESSLSDTLGYPVGCAWDAKSRKLAVMNLFGPDGSQGAVLIYPSGSSTPKSYTNPEQYYYDFGGFDTNGDLFVDGRSQSSIFTLSELPAGATSARTIAISGGQLYFPGMVQWDASTHGLLVGDQECAKEYAACIYRLTVSKSAGKIVAKAKLHTSAGGPVCDLVQGVEAAGKIAGSDNEFCGYAASSTDLWRYPAGGAPVTTNDSTDSSPVGVAISPAATQTPKRAKQSWMDAGASADDLIYVSDADGEVTVYDYATKDLVGVLANFDKPMGECVGTNGDVFIADSGREKIYEYAHGGTKALRTLDDAPHVPIACSVDRTTGNLAVANTGASSADVAVYPDARGKAELYGDSAIASAAACAYNPLGDLLIAGETAGNAAAFAWLPKRLGKLVNITIPGPDPSFKWYSVTGIQWDGQFFALDDESVYRIALLNGQAYYVGETELYGSGVGYGQYGIYQPNPDQQGTEIFAGASATGISAVDYYPYPGGGQPSGEFTHGVVMPYATVISPKS